jgi:hypothetical protein
MTDNWEDLREGLPLLKKDLEEVNALMQKAAVSCLATDEDVAMKAAYRFVLFNEHFLSKIIEAIEQANTARPIAPTTENG